MARLIGPAVDFYRLRLTRLDVTEELDFDWRDDILWRTPPPEPQAEGECWIVEAVTTDGTDAVTRVAAFEDAESAREFLADLTDDLNELTKSQFEAAWLHAAEQDVPGRDDPTEGSATSRTR